MKYSKLFNLRVISVLCFLLFGILIYVGCGGSSSDASLLSNIISNEKPEIIGVNFASEAEEENYYIELEKTLNEKLSGSSSAPSKCATTGLISVILNITTDEIKTTVAYDLSKIVVTANVAGEQPKIVIPVWSIYSASGTLSGTVYTSLAKSETAVFSATYTENGVSKLALFRLKVNGLTSIYLSKTTSEIQIPGTFDLGSELAVTAKYYNGKTQEINVVSGLVWTTNGTGMLNGSVYTSPAKVETAIFTASYTDSGITQKTSFRLTVTGLSTLTLSKLTDEIYLPSTYDLA
ncbi:MAG TPA: hypothetical protein PKK26_05855, partial [Candidatus Wallbacteria bacterium]|nr:hypothetical protein [Candidatus Wallbacteria bacterium]